MGSGDTERSPTSQQESGAAAPLMETHNSKVGLYRHQLDKRKHRSKLSSCYDPCGSAVIQMMAAAKARRGLAFFTFQDEKLERALRQSYRLLRMKGTTVGECSAQGSTAEAAPHPMTSERSPPSQSNCTASWRTTALSSRRPAPPKWNCLTLSKTALVPRVCCEPQHKGPLAPPELTLASLVQQSKTGVHRVLWFVSTLYECFPPSHPCFFF